MKKETLHKMAILPLIISGIISWIIGYSTNNWMSAVGGLALLVGAGGAYTNLKIMRIEAKNVRT
jgi:Na+/H+-dicarboxylate symporter